MGGERLARSSLYLLFPNPAPLLAKVAVSTSSRKRPPLASPASPTPPKIKTKLCWGEGGWLLLSCPPSLLPRYLTAGRRRRRLGHQQHGLRRLGGREAPALDLAQLLARRAHDGVRGRGVSGLG